MSASAPLSQYKVMEPSGATGVISSHASPSTPKFPCLKCAHAQRKQLCNRTTASRCVEVRHNKSGRKAEGGAPMESNKTIARDLHYSG